MQFVTSGPAARPQAPRGRNRTPSLPGRDQGVAFRCGDMVLQGERLLATETLPPRLAAALRELLPLLQGYGSLVASALTAGREVPPGERVAQATALRRAEAVVDEALSLEWEGFRFRPYEPAERLRRLEPSLHRVLGKGLPLSLGLPEGPLVAFGPAEGFDRLVLALAVQVREATGGRGLSRLSLREAHFPNGNPAARLRVEDTGAGWPVSVLAGLPEAGFGAPGGGAEAPGPTVAALVKEMRGAAHLENHLGQGSTLDLWLPLAVSFRP